MVEEATERILWIWTLSELVTIAVFFLLLAASIFGGSSFLSTVSRQVRIIALGLLVIELLIPLFVYLDLRRSPNRSDTIWMHVAAMPLLNILGLMAYLTDRNQNQQE